MEKNNKSNKEHDEFADRLAQAMVDNLNRNVAREQSMLDPYIRDALRFALETHEIHQKQKRKGKDIPYITHPLTVGLILARAGAWPHIIAGGILHDTMEDSVPEHKVTYEILRDRFGPAVAYIVRDVTESNKDLPWVERKQEALEHLKTIEGPSLWVKTADVISNVSEILDDYGREGDAIFSRFNAPKEDIIANYRAVIEALLARWGEDSDNLMCLDLRTLAYDLAKLVEDNKS
jgi:(p)ppGpp synthase/HD superfamily hydrolase